MRKYTLLFLYREDLTGQEKASYVEKFWKIKYNASRVIVVVDCGSARHGHGHPGRGFVSAAGLGGTAFTEERHAGEVAAENPNEIKEGRQQGKADDRGGNTRTDKIMERVDPHGI